MEENEIGTVIVDRGVPLHHERLGGMARTIKCNEIDPVFSHEATKTRRVFRLRTCFVIRGLNRGL